MLNRTVSIAPMMDWTDRHCRYFMRLLTRETLLYTEMVTTGAIIHGDRHRFLAFDPAEQPVAMQLGGSDPTELAQCAKIVEDYGYAEVNLNVGCPSDRVQSGRFGACLFAEPELVAECVAAMKNVVDIPVTVKTRIGIDDIDTYVDLHKFTATVASAGCEHFIIHARKAWLTGLSPKENRSVPPINYPRVYQLKQDFPQLNICINGEIKTVAEMHTHLQHVDGVMLGREAYHNPYLLASFDQEFYGSQQAIKSRRRVIEELIPYVSQQLGNGIYLSKISRHILGLFHGCSGARSWRRYISENAPKKDATINVLLNAMEALSS